MLNKSESNPALAFGAASGVATELTGSRPELNPGSASIAEVSSIPKWKRVFDIIFSLSVLTFAAPLLVTIILLLLAADGRPIVYRQARIGQGGQAFSCLKFRTMVKNADAELHRLLASCPDARRQWDEANKLRNDPRIHWLGRFLRKSSLDELPQFINVLKGEMSVVGPRPIVASEVGRYGAHFESYKAVRPGITGLWQVSGRNSLSYAERVALDVKYVGTLSPAADARIVVATLGIVVTGSGDH